MAYVRSCGLSVSDDAFLSAKTKSPSLKWDLIPRRDDSLVAANMATRSDVRISTRIQNKSATNFKIDDDNTPATSSAKTKSLPNCDLIRRRDDDLVAANRATRPDVISSTRIRNKSVTNFNSDDDMIIASE